LTAVYFVDPLLSFLGRILLYVSNALFHAYVDRLYSEIAVGYPELSLVFLFIFTATVVGITIGFVASYISYSISELHKSKKHRSSRKTVKQKKKINTLKIIIMISIMLSLTLTFGTVDTYIRFKTRTTFEQYIIILSPYISDQKVKELYSQFASMQKKADFDVLMQTIRQIASRHKIHLPKNKLYPL